MYCVYALYSPKYDKLYVGYSSDLGQRLISHNELGKKGWTIRYRPWKLAYGELCRSKAEAMRREEELKTARGRRYLWDIIGLRFKQ